MASVAWRPLGCVVGVLVALLLAFSGRYGYHRDELYFIAAGAHPAWGYPDQPALTPLIAWAFDRLGHGSLLVFRLPAALASGAVSLLTALTARELGGGRFAQVLAAATVAASTYGLISGHLLVTSSIDLLVWVTLIWLVLHILRTGRARLWLVAGMVAGVGLNNKQLPVVLLGALLVAMVLTPPARHWLGSPWLWGGAAVALTLWAPGLAWQAGHGWPQLILAGQIRAEYGTVGERIGFFALQFVLFSIGATLLWVIGLAALVRRRAWATYRVLAWLWLVVLTFFTVTAGQGYYPSGVYPALIGAGAVAVERHRHRWLVAAVVSVSSLATLPAAVPILAARTLAASPWSGLSEVQSESTGWPGFVHQVADAYRRLPADARTHASIFTANYGEAGAIDRFGPALGLPRAWSGHNGYGLWGPPPADALPVIVVSEDGPPEPAFTGCTLDGPVTGPVANEETTRAAIYTCTGVAGSWAQTWPRLVHLSS